MHYNYVFGNPHFLSSLFILSSATIILMFFVQFQNLPIYAQEQNIKSQNDDFESKMLESQKAAISRYESQFCGSDSRVNSNLYVEEIKTSLKCEMPLAITTDDKGIWYISTKHGILLNYDINSRKFTKYIIPVWKSRDIPTDSSQVWELKNDPSGKNLWFTDEKQNRIWKFDKDNKSFEMFLVPLDSSLFGTAYPVSIDFDSRGNVYFVGIRTHSLFIGDVSKMKNGTSSGISIVDLPVGEFKGMETDLVSVGSIVFDKKNSVVWISMLAFGQKGAILKYDTINNLFKIYILPSDLTSPVGLLLDSNNDLWVTDHGTNIFFKFDITYGNITKYTTSLASKKLFGGNEIKGAYTLPYWLKNGVNSTILFNEHTGNKIARFDPANEILIEYWIPSQNKLFGPCNPITNDINNCGIGNILQFADEKDGKIWFTEWSENKIGYIKNISLPFSVTSSQNTMAIKRGESKEIPLTIYANENVNLNMISSSTSTPTGDLTPSSGYFSENSIMLQKGDKKRLSFIMNISPDQERGNYVLMLGADNDSVSVSKAIHILVI